MPRLIDADALPVHKAYCVDEAGWGAWRVSSLAFKNEKCMDATGKRKKLADHLIANGVVVREKGEWVYDHWCEFKCSKCGALSKTEPRGEENFCPNCGADMRKGENG